MDHGYRLRAIVFDFDGTLTAPGSLDFAAIRRNLGCPAGQPILEYLEALTDPGIRLEMCGRLDQFELAAAERSVPNTGAEALVAWIRRNGLAAVILTRNSRASVLRALDNFEHLGPRDFDLLISRDDPVAPKPSGDGILRAAAQLGIDPGDMLVVGDFVFDTAAGRAAGALTALLDPSDDPRLAGAECDFRVRRLDELREIIRAGLPLRAGKLPNDILQTYLRQFHFEDPSVLINPGVGEDIAAVDVAASEVLILKSDPITFATDAIGRYSVLVNANDIATAGAVPRWFLTTLLLPGGITPSQVRAIMKELADACHDWNITLCGGHTEITDAVTRPVVIGMMAGTVRRQEVIDKKRMREGDCVLLTKGVAVEGTAIIAREFAKRLRDGGMAPTEIAAAADYLSQIGILREARLAAEGGLVSAMHDVTEGGLATALQELGIAGGHRIRVDLECIPVLPLTRKICALLDLNPLGLIGSGSLLICCRRDHARGLIERLRAEGIAAAAIGQVLDAGRGITALRDGVPEPWPEFEVDEITKLF